MSERKGFSTRAVHGGHKPDPSTGAVVTPIFATSTYVQSSPGVHQGFDYGRSQNPTRWDYERCVAALESGTAAFAFASGMAATAAVSTCSTRMRTSSRSTISTAARGGCSNASARAPAACA